MLKMFTQGDDMGVKSEKAPALEISVNPSLKQLQLSDTAPTHRPKQPGITRVLLCATHYRLFSGYANVVYNLLRRLATKTDIEVTLFAFQNFKNNNIGREDLPSNIKVYDCFEEEGGAEAKKAGFGENLIGAFLRRYPQDVCIIYNDMSVVAMLMKNVVETLTEAERAQIKFVCYIDQVYQYQKEKYIGLLNEHFHHIIAFTQYWADFIKTQIKPALGGDISILPHGFETATYFPIPKNICRIYYNIPPDAFVIINLNRCQPRKRLDHMCVAFAEVCRRHQDLIEKRGTTATTPRPLRLLVGTALQGCWDIPEILSWEFKKRRMAPELINEYIVAVARPQSLTDREVNILYNAADIGIQAVDGEGMGLTAMEQMGVGIPQVANHVGGFKEFMTPQNAILVEPSSTYYIDNSRDSIGGLAEMCDPIALADGIWKLFLNPALVRKLGTKARADIVQHFKWDVIGDRLHNVIKKAATLPVTGLVVN